MHALKAFTMLAVALGGMLRRHDSVAGVDIPASQEGAPRPIQALHRHVYHFTMNLHFNKFCQNTKKTIKTFSLFVTSKKIVEKNCIYNISVREQYVGAMAL